MRGFLTLMLRVLAVALLVACSGLTPPGGSLAAGGAQDASRWLPDDAAYRSMPPRLQSRVMVSPYTYFRSVNKPWARAMCRAFQGAVTGVSPVRLHGDAHVGQYAFTASGYGLDDFDDTAEGPSFLDLGRFVGSLDLAARERGWTDSRDRLIDEFLRGYYASLEDPSYRPPQPAAVARLRPLAVRDRVTFLAWAQSLMTPDALLKEDAAEALGKIADTIGRARPQMNRRYLSVKSAGWLDIGIGSAQTPKVLVRVEGPSMSPDDDVILEAKQLSNLSGIDCLVARRIRRAIRVVDGTEQIGRLHLELLAVVPRLPKSAPGPDQWWIRNWDPTYGEVQLSDLISRIELEEIARDAGAQLGAANLRNTSETQRAKRRQQEIRIVKGLEPQLRTVTHRMAEDVVKEWERLQGPGENARPPAN